jgi:hypothetical protein
MDLEYRELQRRLEIGDLEALAPIIKFWRLEGLGYEDVALRTKEFFRPFSWEASSIVFTHYFGITPAGLRDLVAAGFNKFYQNGKTPKIELSLDEYNPGDLDINIEGLHLMSYVDPGIPDLSGSSEERLRFMISVESLIYGGQWAPDEWDMKELETDIISPVEAVKQLISHHFSGTINAYFESRSWEPDPE